jgi:hypothetical protein
MMELMVLSVEVVDEWMSGVSLKEERMEVGGGRFK